MRSSGQILIVDAGANSRLSFSLILEKAGYRVFSAAGRLDALAQVEKRHFDLIALEVILPGEDALALAEELGRLCPTSRLVFLTGYVDPATVDRAYQAGAQDYWIKPLDPGDFLGRVARATDGA